MRSARIPYVYSIALVTVCAALLSSCGSGGDGEHQSATDRLVGTYDASVDVMPAEGTNAVGVVEQRPDGGTHIRIDINAVDAIDVSAVVAADGSLTLDGSRITSVDQEVPVTGTATIDAGADQRQISGTIHDGNGQSTSFVMVSPATGTPASLAGSYIFDFDPSPSGRGSRSRTTLVLSVQRDGRGGHGGGTDSDASDMVVGSLSQATCVVSPTGRLRCTGTYHSEGAQTNVLPAPLILHGSLPSASSVGHGDYFWGSLPSAFLIGKLVTHQLPATWPPVPSADDPAFGAAGNVLISDRLDDRDGHIDGLWIGFNTSEQWQRFVELADGVSKGGLLPQVGGHVVPDLHHPLGFYFDPSTTQAAELTLVSVQTTIDTIKADPNRASQQPAWMIVGFPIERIVPPSGG